MIHTIALTFLEGLTQNKVLTLLQHTHSAQLIFEQPEVALAAKPMAFAQQPSRQATILNGSKNVLMLHPWFTIAVQQTGTSNT